MLFPSRLYIDKKSGIKDAWFKNFPTNNLLKNSGITSLPRKDTSVSYSETGYIPSLHITFTFHQAEGYTHSCAFNIFNLLERELDHGENLDNT